MLEEVDGPGGPGRSWLGRRPSRSPWPRASPSSVRRLVDDLRGVAAVARRRPGASGARIDPSPRLLAELLPAARAPTLCAAPIWHADGELTGLPRPQRSRGHLGCPRPAASPALRREGRVRARPLRRSGHHRDGHLPGVGACPAPHRTCALVAALLLRVPARLLTAADDVRHTARLPSRAGCSVAGARSSATCSGCRRCRISRPRPPAPTPPGAAIYWTGWFGGVHTPGYSVLVPPLMHLFSVSFVGAVATVVAAALFPGLLRGALRPDAGRPSRSRCCGCQPAGRPDHLRGRGRPGDRRASGCSPPGGPGGRRCPWR